MFESVYTSALWHCLLKNGVTEGYVSVLRESYRHTLGRVRVYGQLSPPLVVSKKVWQGCPVTPFLFSFSMEYVPEDTLFALSNGGAERLPGKSFYAYDIISMSDNAQVFQRALDGLGTDVSRCALHP